MAQDHDTQPSLNQRVSAFLRSSNGDENPFAVKLQAAEIDRHEFELERALTELRAAQERVDRLRREIREMKE